MIQNLSLHIESLIFAAEKPISMENISSVLEETLELILNPNDVVEAIELVKSKYASDNFSIEVIEISGGLSFMTKGAYHLTIANYLKQTTNKKLSKAAMETLSIIAYKQPVSKSEIEHIRGVNCDYAVQKLLDKELIEIKGRSESVGKPLLYGTSDKFFDYFGLNGTGDLPKLKDFEMAENEIGTPEDIHIEIKKEELPISAPRETITIEDTPFEDEEETSSDITLLEDIQSEVISISEEDDLEKFDKSEEE
jgi:segregation and condensation protein B